MNELDISIKQSGNSFTHQEVNVIVNGINTLIRWQNKLLSLNDSPVIMYGKNGGFFIFDVLNNRLWQWDAVNGFWFNTESPTQALPETIETISWAVGEPKPEYNAPYVINDFVEGSTHQVSTIVLNDVTIKRIVVE